MTNRKLLFSIFLIVFIDLLGFSLILPLLPFYAETLGANPTQVGLLVAVYAIGQFVGAPILGRLSDRFGRRPMLLISTTGTMIGFLLLTLVPNLLWLFAARLFAGFSGGNISIAQAYISDVTDQRNRARGLGLIGAAFGLGFIFGPAAGGVLSIWGFAVPALAGASLAFANLLMVFFWLPESLSQERKIALLEAPRSAFTPQALWQALHRPYVGPLLHTRFFFGLAFSAFTAIFTLYAQYRFGLDSTRIGFILAYVGLLSVIVQGFLIGRLTQRFSEHWLILTSTILMSLALLGWGFAPNIALLLVILAPISLSGGVLNTVINSALSKSVSPAEVGGTLGLSSAIESLTRIIAPSIAGLLLDRFGTSAPGIFASLILIWLVTYIWRMIYRWQPATETQV